MAIQRHGDHDVVADNCRELDCTGDPEGLSHSRVRRLLDKMRAQKFRNIVVDGMLVRRRQFGLVSHPNGFDDRR